MENWDIRFQNLKGGYGQKPVLNKIDGLLPAGKVSVILGESGGGKSTLLRLITGQLKPLGGELFIGEEEAGRMPQKTLRRLRRNMGVLFQDGALLGALTIAQNVALPLSEHIDLPKPLLREEALRVLEMVGLEAFADYFPNQLSGGMRKRAGLARAIIAEPKLLLCDEPTSGLDPITAAKMDSLILDMHGRYPDMGIVVVSHDLSSLERIADNVLVIKDGLSIFCGTMEGLKASSDPYLVQFLSRSAQSRQTAPQKDMHPTTRQRLKRWLSC